MGSTSSAKNVVKVAEARLAAAAAAAFRASSVIDGTRASHAQSLFSLINNLYNDTGVDRSCKRLSPCFLFLS